MDLFGTEKDPEKIKRAIKCDQRMREIMAAYYMEAKSPREQRDKPIAWITSGGPVEPLIMMDIIPIYPENYGAMIGASKMGGGLCEAAERLGYSQDLCSYARSDIASARVNGGPLDGLPEPDMLVCCNNICGTVMKWYEVQARYYDVPLFILDTPIIHTEYTDEMRRYMSRQIIEYVEFLERVVGKRASLERAEEVGRLSLKAQNLWQQILEVNTNKPAPMTCFDAFFHLALIVTLRGTETVVDYYEALLAELKERVANGVGMIPNETYRLLWDNIPVWYRMRWLSDRFEAHGAALVADTYTSGWVSSTQYVELSDPIGSLAEAYARIFLNTGADKMAQNIVKMAERYQADGLVMHSNRSCKPYSFGQYDIRRIVEERAAIPTVILEADMVDERAFSESQIATRIDAFIEMLKERRG